MAEKKPGSVLFPVFLPFAGCRERCVFCSQEAQTGQKLSSVKETLRKAGEDLARFLERRNSPPELAFYGGTFTALPEKDFLACLDFAASRLAEGRVSALRCSTRPDALNRDLLRALKSAGFSLVELGVQSFQDKALSRSRRGYSGALAAKACRAVQAAGLKLGVQLLPGLPGHSPEGAEDDIAQARSLAPACVRLYPCLVLEDTPLAAIWRAGNFQPWSLLQSIEFLAGACLKLWEAQIPIIRMGLAEDAGLAGKVLAGPRHPALGSMARGLALHHYIKKRLEDPAVRAAGPAVLRLYAPRRHQGEFWGQGRGLEPLYSALGIFRQNVFWWDEKSFALELRDNMSQGLALPAVRRRSQA